MPGEKEKIEMKDRCDHGRYVSHNVRRHFPFQVNTVGGKTPKGAAARIGYVAHCVSHHGVMTREEFHDAITIMVECYETVEDFAREFRMLDVIKELRVILKGGQIPAKMAERMGFLVLSEYQGYVDLATNHDGWNRFRPPWWAEHLEE